MEHRDNLGEFLDEAIYPALFARLDHAFPEYGFERRGRGWCATTDATRQLPNAPRAARVYCYENRPHGLVVQGGDFVRFLDLVNGGRKPVGAEFPDAVRKLADLAGVPVPERQATPESMERLAKQHARRGVLETLVEATHAFLLQPAGKEARAYLAGRGYSDDHMRDFRLGLYPSRDKVRAALKAAGHDDASVEEARVLRSDFEGRVIFPWNDARGNPVTLYADWPARPLPASVEKKLLTLAGDGLKSVPLHFDRARAVGHQDLILVEGVGDATLLQALGDSRVIACTGAQPTGAQLDTLARARLRSVTIVLDADGAGAKGTLATIRALLGKGIRAYVARLTDGLDPDEYVLKHGIDAWRQFVDGAENAFRYKARTLADAHRGDAWTDRARDACLDEAIAFDAEVTAPEHFPDLDAYFWPEIVSATSAGEDALRLRVAAGRDKRATEAEKADYARLLRDAGAKLHDGDVRGAKELLRDEVGRLHSAERHRRVEPLRSVAEEMDDFVAWRQQFLGREYLGIPQFTLPTLDRMTWGLRGLILLAAAPNVGKTTLSVQWGLDAVLHNEDTAFLFVSLEMPRKSIQARLVASLAQLHYRTVLAGSRSDGTFTSGELASIERAETRLRELRERLFIVDDKSFPEPTLEKILAGVDTVRARSGARRLYILVDYLNVWPITPEAAKLQRTDGDAEKWRIGQMKELRDYVGGEENAVVVISEAKKPQGAGKDKQWAGDLSDVMGSARGTYTPDIVVLLQNVQSETPEEKKAEEALQRDGKAKQRLVIAKGRDGVDRGSIELTHFFRESRYEEGH